MITVKKKCECTITMDGNEEKLLSDVCELARTFIAERDGRHYIGLHDHHVDQKLRDFIDEIQRKLREVR